MPMTTLTPDWREWIRVNLNRRCSVPSMIEAMVAKDFDPVFAASAVVIVAGENGNPVKTPLNGFPKFDQHYEYDSSRIPITNRIHTRDRVIAIQMRMQHPELILFRGVLSREECDELINRAKGKLSPSTTIVRDTGESKITPNRSSLGTYFHLEEDAFIAALDRRLSDLTNWQVDHCEGIQILHYRIGDEYKPHFDFFTPEVAGSAAPLANGGQRIASVVMYLNDVEEGGETIFPELKLSIVPNPGDAVYFGYCNSRNQLDRLTFHGGSPVIRGEKWIATKWLRQNRR